MSGYNYVITIKQPDYKNANAVSLLMLTLALAVFAYTAQMYWNSREYYNAAILYAVLGSFMVLWCTYCLLFAKKLKRIPYYRFALAAAAIGWFVEPLSNIWMGVLYAIAALAERQVKFPAEIGADEQGIVFNSLPAKSFAWQEIDSMLLKDDVLTINFKNNKIYQKEIEAEVSEPLVKEFNAFCSRKLDETAIAPVS